MYDFIIIIVFFNIVCEKTQYVRTNLANSCQLLSVSVKLSPASRSESSYGKQKGGGAFIRPLPRRTAVLIVPL